MTTTTLEKTRAVNVSWGYYDPTTAQFLTPDPLFALTGSRYGYASNDPINMDDPLGLCWGPICTPSEYRQKARSAIHTVAHTVNNHVVKPTTSFVHHHAKAIGIAAAVVGTVGLAISTGGLGLAAEGGIIAGLADAGVGSGLELAGLTLGAAATASDCSEKVDARCVLEGIGLAAGGAGEGLGELALILHGDH